MSKSSPSRARRRAEMALNQAQERQANFRNEQERAHDAMVEKMQRLRELRLAKEATDKQSAVSASTTKPTKARGSKKSEKPKRLQEATAKHETPCNEEHAGETDADSKEHAEDV